MCVWCCCGVCSSVLDEAEGVARSTFEREKDRAARLAATAASLVKQLEVRGGMAETAMRPCFAPCACGQPAWFGGCEERDCLHGGYSRA